MNRNLENRILNKLLDKYENSKLSKGGTAVQRKIKLTIEDDVLSSYTVYDSYKYSDDNDAIIKKLESLDFIEAEFNNDSFKSLTLNLSNVDSIYDYLKRKKPAAELEKIKSVLSKYEFDNFMEMFIEYVESYINSKYDYPKQYFNDAKQLDQLLYVIKCLLELKEDTKKREFSVKYLGDSKLFESLQGKIIKIIRDFDGNDYEMDENVLANYNIVKNSSYALVKNNLVVKINNSLIDLNALGFELSLSDEMIKCMEILDSNITKVITVENLTTFYSLDDKEAVIIYLAGFHNHTKQSLLLKLYEKYKDAEYYHFGDIDAGGFLIFNNLLEKSGIPFKPYRMNVNELSLNKSSLKKLTDNDKKRLKKMLDDPSFITFYEVISYMLANDVKLEQEAL